MNPIYNLIDTESGNLVGSYESEGEAREVVRDAWSRHGTAGVDGLSLLRVDSDGAITLLGEDGELLDAVPVATGAGSANATST